MSNPSAPAVVVGIDGSKAATQAALWAIDEAVSRDIPLRLVYVIDPLEPSGGGGRDGRQGMAHAALFDVCRAVEATGHPVKVETEVLRGRPLTKLMEESRSAVMVCVGSIGLNHARRGEGSVAATLAGSALCPVAVIQVPPGGVPVPKVSTVVAEVNNGSVLRHAFEEARLRGVALRALSARMPDTAGDTGDGNRLAQAQLSRRLARWTRLYPDVKVESTIIRGHACRYIAANAKPDQLYVTDSHAAQACNVYSAGCSVLTVRSGNL
ncbi:universal stress protein [Mycobacterium kansasii]|uniref:Universal stress family protein n=3 Tax=Mycobacterium kansasii TaxID=1768 RepID=A0A1V3XTP3_MYCKA|nr:universal stress protein [Mycobacterium kansasii]AGZ52748.1 universal stress protein [Mycobacterium kansasii ATCC 12478]ARG61036.1 universal stress protein [Mycobacterium kansasii]ARG68746.1 universal stress protein [Mycobacterium kansasii]ARG76652.1 universal stress protein [Mycobacterium kansasii]ARG82166.1 universal stress protein [Mycobacterium kansasii]